MTFIQLNLPNVLKDKEKLIKNENESSDKINTCRTNLKTGKSSTNIKNYSSQFGIDFNSDDNNIINLNSEENKDTEPLDSIKVNKISNHKHLKSNKI